MLSTDDARRCIAECLHLLPAERIELGAAAGRFLRAPVTTSGDLPPFDRSAFDGYAVKARPEPAWFRLTATLPAGGSSSPAVLGPDECARIFTGAPLPPGADAVAMQEGCKVDGDRVEVPPLKPGEGARWRGEDARAGSALISAGARLGPVELSLCAQLGETRPLVSPQPRVFHVRTGDEIVAPGETPGPGQIRDSNSSLIAGLVAESGAVLVGRATARDRLEELVNACAAAEDADVLLISGGASVGDFDFGRAALAELGFSVRFAGLNLRPGKPLVFATRGRQAAFVIPGNPLSHFVCWHVVIRAALDLLIFGIPISRLAELRLRAPEPLRGNPRETWWPAKMSAQRGEAIAEPLKWQSSGDMTSLAGVNALIRVPSGSPPLQPGAIVTALQTMMFA